MTGPTGQSPLTESVVRRSLQQVVPDPPSPRHLGDPGDPRGLADRARDRAGGIRRRRRTALSALATAAVVAVVAVGVPTLTRGDDGGRGEPATSTSPERSSDPRGWCRENPCTDAEVVAGIRTPLDLPTLAPGEACPVSPTRRFAAGAGFSSPFDAVGPGPLYVAGLPDIVMRAGPDEAGGGGKRWLEQKVIWVVDRSYVGGLLLRGGRIDGPGALRFLHYLGAVGYTDGAGDGKRHRELAYVRGGLSPAGADTTSSYPSGIFVDEPGCYAVQVDGVGFTETLVFRALAP